MAIYSDGDLEIHYDDHGSGFPVLLIAPGGMRSAASFWPQMPWDPVAELSDRYRVISMDQRNAGRSTGPISGDDGWATYTADQLALMNHLGAERFHVIGMCIGGPYIMGLIEAAPDRVASAVVFQPIGHDENRDAFYEMFDDWAEALKPKRPEVSDADWASFRESMYGTDDFMMNVTDDFIASTSTPMLVLLGNDLYHPESASRRLADLAPGATLIEHWKEPEHHDAVSSAVAALFSANE